MGELFEGPGFRTCSRSACRWPAVTTLSFDYAGKRVWLDDLKPGPDPATYDLCSVHAERFQPPTRWKFDDRRPVREAHSDIPSSESAQNEGNEANEKVERLHSASGSEARPAALSSRQAGRPSS
ncbi:MAG: DUF3499 family protein [Actinomycetota bacterium]